MSDKPESLMLRILREMRAEMATKSDIQAIRAEIATKDELRSEINSLHADVAANLITTRKELSEQIVGLRRAVVDYHTSVIGHGVLISDLDARPRRVEEYLNLPPIVS